MKHCQSSKRYHYLSFLLQQLLQSISHELENQTLFIANILLPFLDNQCLKKIKRDIKLKGRIQISEKSIMVYLLQLSYEFLDLFCHSQLLGEQNDVFAVGTDAGFDLAHVLEDQIDGIYYFIHLCHLEFGFDVGTRINYIDQLPQRDDLVVFSLKKTMVSQGFRLNPHLFLAMPFGFQAFAQKLRERLIIDGVDGEIECTQRSIDTQYFMEQAAFLQGQYYFLQILSQDNRSKIAIQQKQPQLPYEFCLYIGLISFLALGDFDDLFGRTKKEIYCLVRRNVFYLF